VAGVERVVLSVFVLADLEREEIELVLPLLGDGSASLEQCAPFGVCKIYYLYESCHGTRERRGWFRGLGFCLGGRGRWRGWGVGGE
jgi:hypothetical protein